MDLKENHVGISRKSFMQLCLKFNMKLTFVSTLRAKLLQFGTMSNLPELPDLPPRYDITLDELDVLWLRDLQGVNNLK